MKTSAPKAARGSAKRTQGSGDWQSKVIEKVRLLIRQADPDATEEAKWKKASNPAGVSVWSHDGMICTGEKYKDKVKLTFPKGSQMKDPSRLFNTGFDGSRRAIDIREDDALDAAAFKELIREAVALNLERPTRKR